MKEQILKKNFETAIKLAEFLLLRINGKIKALDYHVVRDTAEMQNQKQESSFGPWNLELNSNLGNVKISNFLDKSSTDVIKTAQNIAKKFYKKINSSDLLSLQQDLDYVHNSSEVLRQKLQNM